MNLITIDEFKALRDVGNKVDEKKFNESVSLAQDSDVYNALGDFYFELLDNMSDSGYADLMNGSDFVYQGRNLKHKGVKAWVADLVYSRYIINLNVQLNGFGAHTKESQDSKPIDRNYSKDLSKQAQQDAGIKFKLIEKYLETVDLRSEEEKDVSAGSGSSFNSLKIDVF